MFIEHDTINVNSGGSKGGKFNQKSPTICQPLVFFMDGLEPYGKDESQVCSPVDIMYNFSVDIRTGFHFLDREWRDLLGG